MIWKRYRSTPIHSNFEGRGFRLGNTRKDKAIVALAQRSYVLVVRIRWSMFKGRELNSHHPTLHTYRRMFRVFEPMRKTLAGRRNLDVKQLAAILRERLKG